MQFRKTGSYSQPSRGDVHVNRPLTNISVAFMQDPANFVASSVFPTIPVLKQSDMYFTYDRADFNRDAMQKRAPATESVGTGWRVGTDTYLAEVWALHKDLSDQVVANFDSPLSAQRDATMLLSQLALIRKELDWRDQFFVGGNPGTTWTFMVDGAATTSASFDPTNEANNQKEQWNTPSTFGTPIEDVREGKRYVQQLTGLRPNVMVMGRKVFDVLMDHPDLIGRIDRGQTPVGPAMATRANLAALFELDEVVVMDAIVNTAAEGLAESNSFIGGNHALLLYRPPSPGLYIPSAGYTFAWTGLLGSSALGARISSFYIDTIKSERVEMEMAFVHKRVSKDLGYFFENIVL